MSTYKIKSRTWGWLYAEAIKVEGPFVHLTNVTRDDKPFYPSCMIPVSDASLIIPPEG